MLRNRVLAKTAYWLWKNINKNESGNPLKTVCFIKKNVHVKTHTILPEYIHVCWMWVFEHATKRLNPMFGIKLLDIIFPCPTKTNYVDFDIFILDFCIVVSTFSKWFLFVWHKHKSKTKLNSTWKVLKCVFNRHLI